MWFIIFLSLSDLFLLMTIQNVAQQLLKEIRDGRIKNQEELEIEKIRTAAQYGIGNVIKNSYIASLVSLNDNDYEKIRKFLQIKHVRTASGVANIAVMWLYKSHEYSCPFSCIYCPQGTRETDGVLRAIAPKSYTGVEPTTLRAIRNNFDPFLQVSNRIKQLNLIGHPTDKCELIIMGGTFMATPTGFQDEFVKRCFDGFNGTNSKTLEEAQFVNEKAKNRCIGLTTETRADYCRQQQIEQMLRLGCTRVEIGVQTIDDELLAKTKRGHDTKTNIEAIKRLKENGLKACVHWMPGLTGLYGEIDEKKEVEMFSRLFSDTAYRPDELKIYPTLVVPGTELHELWKHGKYIPLTTEQAIRLLIKFKKLVPEYVRIKRIMRDISEHKPEAGAKTTNLRQIAKKEMEKQGLACKCIRCREVGHVVVSAEEPLLHLTEYEASGDREIFLSFEGGGALLGFLRLRLDGGGVAKIRELHVYGSMIPISRKSDAWQHKGLGRKLMKEAEEIARENGKSKITVTSGVGAREYYRKQLGYIFKAPYMVKKL